MDRKGLLDLMKCVNEKIVDMLLNFDVPDSIEDKDMDNFLLKTDPKTAKARAVKNQPSGATLDELQERLNIIRNKMKSKKRRPLSEKALKRREAKKLKKNKEFNKVLVSAAKSIKNEDQKMEKAGEKADRKKDIKPVIPKPVFNEEGKIVYSKFDFASHPGAKAKKSHQNPREILKKIKETDKKISDLKGKGDVEKASEMKNEIAWQKAFDKVEGKKVKDDPKLLYKAIKKKKVEKKKSKKQWQERKKKVDSGIEQRQKKRNENLEKRSKDKKNKKLKKLSKKGRVIPGF